MPASPPAALHFGPFRLEPSTGELWREGVRVHVQDLPFRLLLALLERPGDLVTRTELGEALWGSDTFVDRVAGLNTAVAKLREVLGDDPATPLFIETIPKRGYRFIGRIEERAPSQPTRSGPWKRAALWIAVAVAVVAGIGLAAWKLGALPEARVAVVLFDNETEQPALDRLAQSLTDATVFELTAQPQLAVVGNAAVLRTARPFRDLEKIRDEVKADYIVIGQVQTVDDAVSVRTHLIRAKDLVHVWVDNTRATAAGEAALEAAVAGRVAAAVAAQVRSKR